MKKVELKHEDLQALIGQLSPEQVNDLKKKYPQGIYAISVGGHIAYFRNPSRQDINIASSQMDLENPMDYYELLMNETYLEGSKAIIEDDKLYLGSIQIVKKKSDGDKAELVNL